MNALATLESFPPIKRTGGKFTVRLSNVGNPDFRQDHRRPLPDTVCGEAHVDTLAEARELVALYISAFDLGGGNWNGGHVHRADGLFVGRFSYNGRLWDTERWTSASKEIEVL